MEEPVLLGEREKGDFICEGRWGERGGLMTAFAVVRRGGGGNASLNSWNSRVKDRKFLG